MPLKAFKSLLGCVVALAALPATLPATDAIVTILPESGAGSLRQAIAEVSPGGKITFASYLSGSTVVLTNGELVIGKDLTLDASALPHGLTISGNHSCRIFSITNSPVVSFDSLTLRDGAAGDANGGAIYNRSPFLTLNRCTLTGNSSSNGNGGAIFTAGYMVMNQCTVVSNYAATGGAAYIVNGGILQINHTTIVRNSATTAGGIFNLEVFDYTNSIVALNTGGSGADLTLAGCCGRGNRSGVNLLQSISGASSFPYTGAGIILNVNPQLGTLTNNGGPTPTILPLAGSPVIDACTNGAVTFTNDQRRLPRPADGDGNGSSLADIGAVELGFSPTVFTQPVTNIALTAATLEASVNPRGAVTSYYFEYGTTTNLGNFSATNSLPAGSVDSAVTASITGLSPGNTYYSRVAAVNPYGTTFGSPQTFTTPLYPDLTVSPETDQSTSRGYANPFPPIVATNFVYQLMNIGSVPLDWSVDYLSDWLTASTTSGTLPAGASTQINIWINDNNFLLGTEVFPDSWVGVVRIQNQTASTTTQRHLLLQVIPPVSSGGVVLWGSSTTAPAFVPGLFRISIEPANLVAQGAAWHPLNATPDPGWLQDTANWYYPYTPTNSLEFFPVPGYITATNQRVLVTPGSPTILHAVYVPIPAPPLLLSGPEVLSAGKFRFRLSGPTGKVYAVQTSTNLAAWNDLQFLTNTTGTNIFTNTPAIGVDKNFFRARQLP